MNNNRTQPAIKKRQQGMTLIELTVVLLVLIGLAGLMIPYVTGFVQDTHDGTGTSNLARLNNNIQRFQSQFASLPDDLHSLVENTSGAVYTDLMNPALFAATTYTEDGAATMAATEIPLASLRMAGLSSVYDMTNGGAAAVGDSATFDAANAQVTVPMPTSGSGGAVAVATVAAAGAASIEDHLADAFGMQPGAFDSTCYDYVALGVGQESELIGRTMSDAPIHFAQNGDMGPQNKYNRFVAIFEVDKDNATAGCSADTDPARFVGTAMAMGEDHLFGLAHTLGHVYERKAAK